MSVVAPELVVPVWHHRPVSVGTHGDEVAELCAAAGFAPSAEQRMVLDDWFAYRADGSTAAFEAAVIAPRQNLKTAVLEMAALGWLMLDRQRLTIWSAHNASTAAAAFEDLTNLIESVGWLASEVRRVSHTNGDEHIETKHGARISFRTRTSGGARGLSADRVVLDEAFALKPAHMGALLPTLSARPDPQVCYGSSAGLVDSAVLRALRDRGRSPALEPRLAYAEWSDPSPGGCADSDCDHRLGASGCALDDESRWARVNPSLGQWISLESIRVERRALPPDEFARERMGWWDEPASSGHDLVAQQWSAAASDAAPQDPLSLAIDVSPGRVWGSIAVCGSGVVEVVDRRKGAGWLAKRVGEIVARHDIGRVGLDPAGPAGSLMPDLERLGVPLVMLDGRESVRACEAFAAAVSEHTITHRGQPELDAAVDGARRRQVGDGWKWSRRDSTVDISPLVAATVAHWLWLQQTDAPIEPEVYFV